MSDQKAECSAAEIANLRKSYPNLHVMKQTAYLMSLQTIVRDRTTAQTEFVFCSNQWLRLLCEFALSLLEYKTVTVSTPNNVPFVGATLVRSIVGVSILRSGESMEGALRAVAPPVVRFGKILIQRNESTVNKTAQLFYSKLPKNISNPETNVLLLYPMLATGGSATMAVRTLLEAGVKQQQITFVNLVSCPSGIQTLCDAYPLIRVVTSAIDPVLNDVKYICPGIGDFGDRYYGTTDEP